MGGYGVLAVPTHPSRHLGLDPPTRHDSEGAVRLGRTKTWAGEVPEHGTCSILVLQRLLGDPGADLGAGTKAELGQDVLDVRLCGALRDDQLCSDVLVPQPIGDEPSDLLLAWGEWRAARASGRSSGIGFLVVDGESERLPVGERTAPVERKDEGNLPQGMARLLPTLRVEGHEVPVRVDGGAGCREQGISGAQELGGSSVLLLPRCDPGQHLKADGGPRTVVAAVLQASAKVLPLMLDHIIEPALAPVHQGVRPQELPEAVAGPLTTVKLTGRPEEAVAAGLNELSPTSLSGG